MATYSAAIAVHETLVANTADTVTFSRQWTQVEILNKDSVNSIYFRVDGGSLTVAGADCLVVLPGNALVVSPTPALQGASAGSVIETVQLISTGSPAYAVTGVA
jgi:hypothetical protein